MGHPVYVSTLTKKVGGGQKNPKNPTFSKKAKKKLKKAKICQNLPKSQIFQIKSTNGFFELHGLKQVIGGTKIGPR
jgi:hypothetical protein